MERHMTLFALPICQQKVETYGHQKMPWNFSTFLNRNEFQDFIAGSVTVGLMICRPLTAEEAGKSEPNRVEFHHFNVLENKGYHH